MKLTKFKNIFKILTLPLLIALFLSALYLNKEKPTDLFNREGSTFEKAVVIDILQDNIQDDNSRIGKQTVKVKILSGSLKGNIYEASSTSSYLYGADCTLGLKVIVSLNISENSTEVSVYNYYRSPCIYLFIIIFILLLLVIGGKQGLKSALGLIFTFICIIFIFIPMLYKGFSPFLSAVFIIIITANVSIFLIGGFSKKSFSAILSTIIGVILAGILAKLFCIMADISSYNISDIEELIYIAQNSSLKIDGLLFSGILISSLGAVMDVSVSLASSINELHIKKPEMTSTELFKSGINIGKDMMCTMSNTLILAFTGGSLSTLIILYSYNMSYNQLLNMYSIGIEIMEGLSGTIALILTVPLAAFISSKIISR